jgi:hypothetical protein
VSSDENTERFFASDENLRPSSSPPPPPAAAASPHPRLLPSPARSNDAHRTLFAPGADQPERVDSHNWLSTQCTPTGAESLVAAGQRPAHGDGELWVPMTQETKRANDNAPAAPGPRAPVVQRLAVLGVQRGTRRARRVLTTITNTLHRCKFCNCLRFAADAAPILEHVDDACFECGRSPKISCRFISE